MPEVTDQPAKSTEFSSWRSPQRWLALACIPAAAGLLLVALLLLAGPWWLAPFAALAERLNPGVDAPDNWALALTYVLRLLVLLWVMAAGLVAVAGLKWWGLRRPV